MDIKSLHEKYQSKEWTVSQYIEKIFETIESNNYNSFITLDKENALEQAKLLDHRLEKGEPLTALFGVPISIKDNILTKGLRTTSASKTLEDFIPVYDATVVEKVKATDAIIIGKTNMDEFAMGGSSETSYFGPTVNPFKPGMIPGGSSSGSAASVAGHESLLSLGTDTGGSVRNPANYTNIVGFAPTYGAISRYGVVSMANSFDRVGILANSVADTRTFFDHVHGLDVMDATSVEIKEDEKIQSLEGVRIAYIKLIDAYHVDQDVKENYEHTLKLLEEKGAILEEVTIDLLERLNQVYTIIMSVEVSSNMARIDGIRYGQSIEADVDIEDLYYQNRSQFFGEEIKRRIALGNYFASKETDQAHYKKAMQVRELIRLSFEEVFDKHEFFLSPTNTQLPYEMGSRSDDANAAYDSGMFNTIANIVNVPSISIPVSKTKLGSVQLTGRRNQDYQLLDVAELLERSLA